MIVKINGVPIQEVPEDVKVVVRPNPKLRRLAITLWSVAGSMSFLWRTWHRHPAHNITHC
ncbi:hypothetical protein M4D57_18520 [Brevibacillus borstelensis]|uniref:hypothetical protein n=1 Tax=Brevibacillus borstelensis TaxID=45462 RepID=UPI00203F486D|nr:hypothetical protein [Brevibacillus borstelensis]MCM3560564.1 hypothetical protein [Brevibacillus borstelensis]